MKLQRYKDQLLQLSANLKIDSRPDNFWHRVGLDLYKTLRRIDSAIACYEKISRLQSGESTNTKMMAILDELIASDDWEHNNEEEKNDLLTLYQRLKVDPEKGKSWAFQDNVLQTIKQLNPAAVCYFTIMMLNKEDENALKQLAEELLDFIKANDTGILIEEMLGSGQWYDCGCKPWPQKKDIALVFRESQILNNA
jgi:tetratricopeptide (TPR) repeat protein